MTETGTTTPAYFLERLVPVCDELLAAGEIRDDVGGLELMRGVGNLCVGAEEEGYDARRLVGILLAGLRTGSPGSPRP